MAAIAEDDEGVVPEELGDGALVVLQVVVEGVLKLLVRGFQLDKYQRDAVDETDQIRTALIHLASNPELGGKKEVVVLGGLPVDDPDDLGNLLPLVIGEADFDTVFQKVVDFPVGLLRDHYASVSDDLLDGDGESFRRDVGVELQ